MTCEEAEVLVHGHDQLVVEGKMKAGRRLAREGKTVSKDKITDGPFAEAKEVIGGYWFVLAGSLDLAVLT